MKVIIGKLNTNGVAGYWKIESDIIDRFNLNLEENYKNLIGNYAIVENMSNYDIVRIIGVAEVSDECETMVIGKKISKRVTNILEEKCVTGELDG